MKNADIIVVGGGLSGAACALALAQTGARTIHAAPPPPIDHRTSALMGPSTAYLQQLGLFENPDELGTPLRKIRIIDATRRLIRAPETLFDCGEVGLDSFAWNFPNIALSQKLEALATSLPNLTHIQQPAISMSRSDAIWNMGFADDSYMSAPLLIGADGKNSFVRKSTGTRVRAHQFDQSALVCDLTLERSLEGSSVEFHYENGPFTLVPAGENRANLVWIDNHQTVDDARALPTNQLIEILLEKSQRLFGHIKLDTKAFVFPLSSLEALPAGKDGTVLVGEAAHAFPPIGAQGLNLGLRDVEDLVKLVSATNRNTVNWANHISLDYANKRAQDVQRTGKFVDTLFNSLLSDFLPAQAARASGLWALKLSGGLREKAFKLGMGER